MRPLATLLVLALVGGGSCTSRISTVDPGDEIPDAGTEDPAGTLIISPAQTEVTLANGRDQTLDFRARSDRFGDVTGQASWTLSDPTIGDVQKGRLTLRGALDRGGTYSVGASFRNQSGAAQLTVKVLLGDVLDPSAPADAKDYFSGPGGGPAPQPLYPFDNTLMAPNVLQVVLQWTAGAGQQVFKIDLAGPAYQRTHYVGAALCPGGKCSYPVDDKLWSAMAHASAGSPLSITISGSAQKGGMVGRAAPVNLQFSPVDIKGGLYYFTTTIKGIKRVPLGASKPVDFISNGDETGCAGCHAVSRDGKRVAVEFGSANTRVGSTVVDGSMPKTRLFNLSPGVAWNFAWFDPTGDMLLTNWNGALTVRDAKTGQAQREVPTGMIGGSGAAMPEWSPDGKWIAYVRKSTAASDYSLQNSGDIALMPYNNGAFGPSITLVAGAPSSEVHFWPSWTPDSKWLVFNSFECAGTGCGSYNAVKTRLRLVRAVEDNGQPVAAGKPVELLSGTHEKWRSNNWPKVAPFLQSGRIIFVVYSANYGWGHNASGRPQLFMFGVDLSKAQAGDPSYHPVWLPFQEASTNNHSAIWTTDVACVTNADCPVEFQCTMGSCVPRLG